MEVIKRYFTIFGKAYQNEIDARIIEEKCFSKDKVKPIFLIIEESEQEKMIILADNEIPHDYSFEAIEEIYLSDYVRKCSECDEYFNEGYFVGTDMYDYYCSKECLHKNYTHDEYMKMYEDDEAFWTQLF